MGAGRFAGGSPTSPDMACLGYGDVDIKWLRGSK